MVPTTWPPRRVGRDDVRWTDQLRMIWKARPCGKLTGMIDYDLVPISHVSGSHHIGRILHEVIIFTMLVTRCRRGGAMCSAFTGPVVRSDG